MSEATATTAPQIHAVDSPEPVKVQEGGLTQSFVPRVEASEEDLRWFPFPGLETTGAEIRLRHQNSGAFEKERNRINEHHKQRKTATATTDVWRALTPRLYATLIVADWRTPTKDEAGAVTGHSPGIPWGSASGTIEAQVYRITGRGKAALKTETVSFDVDQEGYLISTVENREKVFAAFPDVLNGIVDLASDGEAFGLPDEEGIRGN